MIAPAASVANHLLSRETWARERLIVHAGKAFAVAVGPFTTTLVVEPTGMLAAASAAHAADVTLRISPFDVPSLLADPARWNTVVATDGDGALATTLADLAQTLPWFVERTFASLLGPVAGQRVADAGRAMLELPGHAAARVVDGVASYAGDEAGVATRGIELRVFVEQVAEIASRTEALAARIAALETAADRGLTPTAASDRGQTPSP